MPKMHQNTLGGRAPPRPAGRIAACAVLQGNSPPQRTYALPGHPTRNGEYQLRLG